MRNSLGLRGSLKNMLCIYSFNVPNASSKFFNLHILKTFTTSLGTSKDLTYQIQEELNLLLTLNLK